jgi:hypothetical protein
MVDKGGDVCLIRLLLVEYHILVRDRTRCLLGRIIVGRGIARIRLRIWTLESLAAPPGLVREWPRARLGYLLSYALNVHAA